MKGRFVDFKEDFNFCPQNKLNKLKGILQTAILVKFLKYLYFWVEKDLKTLSKINSMEQ